MRVFYFIIFNQIKGVNLVESLPFHSHFATPFYLQVF